MRRLFLVGVLMLSGAAHADNGMFYVGVGISRDIVKDIITTNSYLLGTLKATSWKAMAGVRPISLFAVEADYLDLGSQTLTGANASSAHVAYKAFSAYAVGFAPIPVPNLDVFGKVGVARWTSSGSAFVPNTQFFSLSDNGTQFAWGVGAQVRAGNIGGRLEYENFNIRNTNGASVISLSVYLSLL